MLDSRHTHTLTSIHKLLTPAFTCRAPGTCRPWGATTSRWRTSGLTMPMSSTSSRQSEDRGPRWGGGWWWGVGLLVDVEHPATSLAGLINSKVQGRRVGTGGTEQSKGRHQVRGWGGWVGGRVSRHERSPGKRNTSSITGPSSAGSPPVTHELLMGGIA